MTTRQALCALLTILLMITLTFGCRQQGTQKFTPEEEKTAKERQVAERLHAQAVELYRERKYQEAIPLLEQALDIKKKVMGKDHKSTADSLNNLAKLYELTGDYAKALPLYIDSLEINRRFDRQSTANCLNNLAGLYRLMGDFAKAEPLLKEALEIHMIVAGEDAPATAGTLHNLGQLYYSMGDFARAEPLFSQALEIYRKELGEENEQFSTSLKNMAGFYRSSGDYSKAESLYKQAWEIRKKVFGADHRMTAEIIANLAPLYEAMGDYANAESLYKQTVNTARKLLDEDHPNTAVSINNLANLYQTVGDYVKAELLYKRSLELTMKALGDDHLSTADGRNNLAYLYKLMGDRANAERLQKEVMEMYQKALDEDQENRSAYAASYATSLNNLAGLYQSYGEFAKAEPMYKQALEIRREEMGKKHRSTIAVVSNLALLYELMGDNEEAETRYKEAKEAWESQKRNGPGDDRDSTAASLNDLAGLYTRIGKFADAESLQQEALEFHKKFLGDEHPRTVESLLNLANIYHSKGDYAKAESLLEDGVVILVRHVMATFAIRSGQLQKLGVIDSLRENFEAWMAVAPPAGIETSKMSSALLAMKGVVHTSEARTRGLEQNDEVAELVKSLQTLSRKYASVAYHVPRVAEQSASSKKRIEELTEQIEKAESDLSSKSGAFQRRLEAERMTGNELQKKLPNGTALVDFLSYARFTQVKDKEKENPQRERHLLAMVTRPDKPIARVELGPLAPIAAAIDLWRENLAKSAPADKAGQKLRGLVWQPLEPMLADIKTVLISPDGVTAQIPFAALPGSKTGSYLLEERAIAIVPVPQLIPQLVASSDPPADSQSSLMVVGGVNYDGPKKDAESRAASRTAAGRQTGEQLLQFAALSDSSKETAIVRDIFKKNFSAGEVRQSQMSDATESAISLDAPEHRWLHIATHGYFAPSQVRSAVGSRDGGGQTASLFGRRDVSGIQSGLLTGIVLAGANTDLKWDEDDGILTALEVEALDLRNVELLMFSNCETGVGRVAGGEGLLRLQRAFQVAGTKTFVASLWNVPHEANVRLMERFYGNLWDKKMPKVEALREAQLWLMKNPVAENSAAKVEVKSGQALDNTSPNDWGAYVLSGDWR